MNSKKVAPLQEVTFYFFLFAISFVYIFIMSFNCQNTLTIVGSSIDLDNFISTHLVCNDGIKLHFDFNTVIQPPEKVTVGSRIKAWRLKNWGCTSNSLKFSYSRQYCVFKCKFQTTPASPEILITKLIEIYPSMNFHLRFKETEMLLSGSILGGAGNVTLSELNELPQPVTPVL
jgi:hypothetical protein